MGLDPLLDMAEGGPPTLLELLKARYVEAMTKKNEELREDYARRKAADPPQIDVQAAVNSISTFLNFCAKYLTEHRPVELFYPDANYGIKLSNGESFVVATPIVVQRGSMQPSNYAPITGGKYIAEMQDTGGAHAITGRAKPVPKGATDMTIPQPASNRTISTPAKSFDHGQ